MKAISILPSKPETSSPVSGNESEVQSQNSDSEVDTPAVSKRRKGWALRTKVVLSGSIAFGREFPLLVMLDRGMTVKESNVKYNNPDRKRVAEWLEEYAQPLF